MPDYGFRSLVAADLPMLAGWLASPVVAAWWPGAQHQLGLVTEDMENPAMTQRIVLLGDQPIAYVQHFRAQEWQAPHFADLPPDAIAMDVLAAPEGLGHGGGWIRALGDLLLRQATAVAVDPAPTNLRAIRAFETAGFAGDQVRLDAEGHPARVMTRLR